MKLITSLKALLAISALSVGLATTAACGGGGTPAGPPGSVMIEMSEFKFNPSNPSLPAGKATFLLVNNGGVSHDMVIMTADGGNRLAQSELVQPGNSSTFEVPNLAPGTYPFVCDQPGHAEQGMKGTLTVK